MLSTQGVLIMSYHLSLKLRHIGLAAIAVGGVAASLPVLAEGTAYVQHNPRLGGQ
jgi:hypothetical protein